MSLSRERISICLATYNGARYIGDQLHSIAVQTHPPDEIVIGDDRSSDNTLAIVESFQKRTGLTVRAFTNPERLGSTRNFQEIIPRCRGDIIVFSDQDDVWRPVKLERIAAAFRTNPDASYVFSNGTLIDEGGRPLRGSIWQGALFTQKELAEYRDGNGIDVLLRHNVVTGATMAARLRGLETALPIPRGWIHDYWFAFMLETMGRGVAIDEPLISYRQHGSQQVGLFRYSSSYAVQTVRRNQSKYCLRQATCFSSLAQRLRERGAPSYVVELVRGKATFHAQQAEMRRSPRSAARLVLSSWRAGDYGRFSPGYAAIVLDLAASAYAWGATRDPGAPSVST